MVTYTSRMSISSSRHLCPAAIAFLDPPYDQEREYTAAMELLAAKPPELVIVQHSVRFALPERYGSLSRYRMARQGDNVLSFFGVE